MASDIKTSSEEADMSECDGEKVVTMMDVLREQEDFEEDANAVLGASDEKDCTYSKGYVKRQAIYACMTCCPEAKSDPTKRAGVCLACSLMCHENHELVELYTKRNFRCDCGNPKFSSNPCTFTSDKNDLNENNYYNQNFSGLYCICQRPYPDPESTVEDEMIQCIICEDWLHASHLESTVPTNEQYSEMICKSCMDKNEFLHDYSNLIVNIENVDVDVVHINGSDANNPKLLNGDSKTKAIDSSLNEDVSKPDVEMIEEKLKTSITATDTSKLESEETEMETVSKEESDTGNKMNDESMETNQSTQVPPSEETSKAATSINPEPSTDKSEQEENTLSETKTDTISEEEESSKALSDTPTVSDEPESNSRKTNEDNVPEQSEDIANSKEHQSSEESNNKQDKESPTDEPEKSKIETEEEAKAYKLNVEKMEEDRLLADPEDDIQKPETVEINNTIPTVNNITSNDTQANENVESKSENETKSDSGGQTNALEEKLNTEEISKSNVQSKTNSNNGISENNSLANSDSSNDNKTQSGNIPDEDKNVTEPSIQNECTKEDKSSSSEKISEKRKLEEECSDSKEIKKPKLDEKVCVRPKEVKKVYKGATFWPSNFRQKLCTCQECISMYNDLSVLFLTDPEDTVSAYENLGKEKINGEPTTQYEKGLQALSSLDRMQQINALTEYNKMRDKLLDFLKSFKDRKEIVKEEDIKAFFAGMRPKREPDGVYFCR